VIVATSLFLSQVYVIGEEGILEELELAGFTGLGGPVIYSFLFSK
jgi:ribonucleotide monophosphatase NagD (HAD superfamily)